MKNVATILSAGTGSRYGSKLPKQYTLLEGKPVLYYTINSFLKAGIFNGILIVAQPEYFDFCRSIWDKFFAKDYENIIFDVTEGGYNRQESLYLGCKATFSMFNSDDTDICVFSHCAARPVVSKDIIIANQALCEHGKSVDTVKNVYDTVIYESEEGNCSFIDRSKTYLTLTPQTFFSTDYINAYEQLISQNISIEDFTCACGLMKAAGYPIKLVKTDENIYKLTTKEDVEIIRRLILKMADS